MTVDVYSRYRTSGGDQVRIYATDGSKSFPVHGAILIDGAWDSHSWMSDGRWRSLEPHEYDLIEINEAGGQ